MRSFLRSARRLYGTVRRYTADHEWIQPSSEGRYRVGITDYGQRALGDLVYVELPKLGATVKQRELLGIVESVKGASDVYAPVTGTVVAVNEGAASRPSVVNKSAEADGWLCEIEADRRDEYESLFDEQAYEAHCQGKSTAK